MSAKNKNTVARPGHSLKRLFRLGKNRLSGRRRSILSERRGVVADDGSGDERSGGRGRDGRAGDGRLAGDGRRAGGERRSSDGGRRRGDGACGWRFGRWRGLPGRLGAGVGRVWPRRDGCWPRGDGRGPDDGEPVSRSVVRAKPGPKSRSSHLEPGDGLRGSAGGSTSLHSGGREGGLDLLLLLPDLVECQCNGVLALLDDGQLVLLVVLCLLKKALERRA